MAVAVSSREALVFARPLRAGPEAPAGRRAARRAAPDSAVVPSPDSHALDGLRRIAPA
jgi:hypothetical protein